jgi:hypothetical protein
VVPRVSFSGNALWLLAVATLLSACSQLVEVDTDFPEPLVTPLALKVGLRYGDSIKNYSYKEELPADGDWTFELGAMNVRLFDTIFSALFAEVVYVDATGGSGEPYSTLDAVIEPTIEAFEFSLPRQSQSDQYSVWIRYNLHVYAADGTLITNWPVSAYGQADSRLFGADDAMAQATISAMRDAVASIVTGFEKEPKIKAALLTENKDDES